MTDSEIDDLLAGESLDRLIHERVFGRRVVLKKGGNPYAWYPDGSTALVTKDRYIDPDDTTMYLHVTDGYTGMIPCYSHRIADAWAVVAKIGLCVDYQTNWCIVSKDTRILSRTFNDPPLAICRAALKYLKGKE